MRAEELLPQQRASAERKPLKVPQRLQEAPRPAASSYPPSAAASLSFQVSFHPTRHLAAVSLRLPLHPHTFFLLFFFFFQRVEETSARDSRG